MCMTFKDTPSPTRKQCSCFTSAKCGFGGNLMPMLLPLSFFFFCLKQIRTSFLYKPANYFTATFLVKFALGI